MDPSPHPDLTWLRPPGNQHLVEEVRREVIGSISYRPFEGDRRVFVIEAADAMAEESQNALLKTLEEPPGYAHMILITAEPAALLDTVLSRCTAIRFAPLPPESLQRRLAAELPGQRRGRARGAGAARRRRPGPSPPARLADRPATARLLGELRPRGALRSARRAAVGRPDQACRRERQAAGLGRRRRRLRARRGVRQGPRRHPGQARG